jgi:hypothetical protein
VIFFILCAELHVARMQTTLCLAALTAQKVRQACSTSIVDFHLATHTMYPLPQLSLDLSTLTLNCAEKKEKNKGKKETTLDKRNHLPSFPL